MPLMKPKRGLKSARSKPWNLGTAEAQGRGTEGRGGPERATSVPGRFEAPLPLPSRAGHLSSRLLRARMRFISGGVVAFRFALKPRHGTLAMSGRSMM